MGSMPFLSFSPALLPFLTFLFFSLFFLIDLFLALPLFFLSCFS